ncbi:MAG: transposase family protein, partial [Candidatus Dojkabacteria bacterium]|nr:transposase family protein [Candidatus Dojkabacteria bacterium]
MFTRVKFPFQYMKNDDYRHIVAFKPNGCIQIDFFTFGKDVAEKYRIVEWYTIGVDVYSRYTMVYIGSKESIFTNFKGVLDLFSEKPDMVTVDAEFNVKKVRDYCEKNNIKFFALPSGSINANNIAERTIAKIKDVFRDYIYMYNDEIIKRIEKNIDPKRHSYIIINSILYYLNRKFHTSVKGIPIEIYFGYDFSQLPSINYVKYPEFDIGQYVYLVPRGRQKSYAFQKKKIATGILGQIIKKPTKSVYTIKT